MSRGETGTFIVMPLAVPRTEPVSPWSGQRRQRSGRRSDPSAVASKIFYGSRALPKQPRKLLRPIRNLRLRSFPGSSRGAVNGWPSVRPRDARTDASDERFAETRSGPSRSALIWGAPKSETSCPAPPRSPAIVDFSTKPPGSAAMATHIAPETEFAARMRGAKHPLHLYSSASGTGNTATDQSATSSQKIRRQICAGHASALGRA